MELFRTVRDRFEETGMVEVGAGLLDADLAEQTGLVQTAGEVLAVLTATRVRGVGAGDQAQHPTVAIGVQGGQGVGRVGLPVAVAEVDRQPQVPLGQLALQSRDEGAVLLVDGGAAAQGAVVFGDLLEPLIGHAAPGGDVAQEGDDVVLALGAAEGGEQDRVVDWSAHRSLSVSRRIRWADGADGADRAGRADGSDGADGADRAGRADGSDGADGPAGLAEPTPRQPGHVPAPAPSPFRPAARPRPRKRVV